MQSSSFDIWTEIWKYIEKKKEAYQSFYEGNIENLLLNMRRDGYWGTNFELLDFSDLMRININIYTSLNQDHQEFAINHPHNTNEINTFLRNWRHYEGLQMHENEQLFELPAQN